VNNLYKGYKGRSVLKSGSGGILDYGVRWKRAYRLRMNPSTSEDVEGLEEKLKCRFGKRD